MTAAMTAAVAALAVLAQLVAVAVAQRTICDTGYTSVYVGQPPASNVVVQGLCSHEFRPEGRFGPGSYTVTVTVKSTDPYGTPVLVANIDGQSLKHQLKPVSGSGQTWTVTASGDYSAESSPPTKYQFLVKATSYSITVLSFAFDFRYADDAVPPLQPGTPLVFGHQAGAARDDYKVSVPAGASSLVAKVANTAPGGDASPSVFVSCGMLLPDSFNGETNPNHPEPYYQDTLDTSSQSVATFKMDSPLRRPFCGNGQVYFSIFSQPASASSSGQLVVSF